MKMKTVIMKMGTNYVTLKNVDALETSYKITVMNPMYYPTDSVKNLKKTVNLVLVFGATENKMMKTMIKTMTMIMIMMKTMIKITIMMKMKMKTVIMKMGTNYVTLKNVDALETSYKITVMNLMYSPMDSVKNLKKTVNLVQVFGATENKMMKTMIKTTITMKIMTKITIMT